MTDPALLAAWNRALDGVRALLSLQGGDERTRMARIAEMEPFAGPYLAEARRGGWQGRVNALLNRLLWRQHRFNQLAMARLHEARCAAYAPDREVKSKPLLLVIAPSDMTAPDTGGATRMWGLCGELAKDFRVEFICVTRWWKEPKRRAILPGVDLISIPMSAELEAAFERGQEAYGAASAFLTMGDPAHPFPLFDNYLRLTAPRAAAALLVGPYLDPRIRAVAADLPVACDMHDVIAEYVGRMAGERRDAAIARLREIESELIRRGAALFSVCQSDAEAIIQAYPEASGKLTIVPNGVACNGAVRLVPSQSRRIARDFGLEKPVILFIGSVLRWNIHAMAEIVERFAPAIRDALWVIVGVDEQEFRRLSGCRARAENVIMAGRVSEPEKEAIFALSALAVAPMRDGTGSSLKIPDYIAHGKPVVSTAIGMRGYPNLEEVVDVVPIEQFEDGVRRRLEQLAAKPDALDDRAESAWRFVRAHFDWQVIGREIATRLKQVAREVPI